MANATIIEQKQQIVSALVEKIKDASSGVLVDYKGISVENDTKLRADLRKEDVHYAVVKNTLCARAFDQLGFSELNEVLNGNTALALSSDQVAAARILNNYAKNNDHFVIKAGFVDGRILTAEEVKALADIPSKEILIGRILGSLQSSLYGFAYAIQAILDKKTEAAGGAPAEAASEEPAPEPAPEPAAEAPAAE